MESTFSKLKEAKKGLKINVKGNPQSDSLCLYICNHNCLMDIFYLPMSIDKPIIDMISARLTYKKVPDRLKMVDDYLYSMPIEAHGGKVYSDMCLDIGTIFLEQGISVGIFPEGAYLPENVVYKGRTGASRMLYSAVDKGLDVKLIPVAIDVNGSFDLDSYQFDDRQIDVTILPPVNYENSYDMFSNTNNRDIKNNALHRPIDESMMLIAEALNRPYSEEYIKLFPKGNVIFSDGQTIETSKAQEDALIKRYNNDLLIRKNKLIESIKTTK